MVRARNTPGLQRASPVATAENPRSACWKSWAIQHGVPLVFIRPGRPMENGSIESVTKRLRDECLNADWFAILADAKRVTEAWRREYNESPLHKA